MSTRFKFVSIGLTPTDETHIWQWNQPQNLVSLSVLKNAVRELYVLPEKCDFKLLWFDGEDKITISTTSELQQILKDSSSPHTPHSGSVVVRLEIHPLGALPIPTESTPLYVTQVVPAVPSKFSADKTNCEKSVCEAISSSVKPQTTLLTDVTSHNTPQPDRPKTRKMATAISSRLKESTSRCIQANASISLYENQPHPGIRCDGCEESLRGIRYKCLACDDFDLCAPCFTGGGHTHHPFLAIRSPKFVRIPNFDIISHGMQTEFSHTTVDHGTSTVPMDFLTTCVDHGTSPILTDVSTPEWEVLSDCEDDLVVNEILPVAPPPQHPASQLVAECVELESPQIVECEEAHALLIDSDATSLDHAILVNEDPSSQPHSNMVTRTVSTPSRRSNAGIQACVESESSEAFVSANLSPRPEGPWDFQAMQNFFMDAWQHLKFPRPGRTPATSVDELQVLLDRGYSNEAGILTFLLTENGNNAAAVLHILEGQNI